MMSKIIVHNKLVRDKILDIINAVGKKCKAHTADDKEYQYALYNKIIEEAADIMEVVNSLFVHYDFSLNDVGNIRELKAEKGCGFQKRIKLKHIIDLEQ